MVPLFNRISERTGEFRGLFFFLTTCCLIYVQFQLVIYFLGVLSFFSSSPTDRYIEVWIIGIFFISQCIMVLYLSTLDCIIFIFKKNIVGSDRQGYILILFSATVATVFTGLLYGILKGFSEGTWNIVQSGILINMVITIISSLKGFISKLKKSNY